MTRFLTFVILGACSGAPAPVSFERDGAPVAAAGTWTLEDGSVLTRDGGHLDHGDLAVRELVEGPVVSTDAAAFVYTERAPGVSSRLIGHWHDGEWHRRELAPGHAHADRVAVGDGTVAFVSGKSGLASVYVVGLRAGEPVQLTNVGLKGHKGGGPPVGFVAPPHAAPLRVVGGDVVWDSPDGRERVSLPF